MTLLGKIVVFVNLILSLGIGALIVANYVARTNWHAAYDEAVKSMKAAQENARASDLERTKFEGELKQAKEQLAAKDKAVADTTQDFESRMQTENGKLKQQVAALKEALATAQAAAGELDRLHKESDYLKGLVGQRDVQIRDMEKKVEDSRSKAVEFEIAAKAAQGRNERLLEENEKLSQQLASRGSGAATGGISGQAQTRRSPSIPDVEGTIKKVDQASGMVSITIGSDAGINKGDTLEAFRLNPEPQYLGRLQVVAVQPDQAVCQPIDRTRGRLQVGDRVSSSVVSRR